MDSLTQYNTPNKKEERRLDKVVTGEVKVKKRSKGRKLVDLFFNEDWGDIRDYVIFEKAIPDVKNVILDIMEMIFFGSAKRRTARRDGTYVSYNSYSSGRRVERKPQRTVYSFDDIIIDSRGEAEQILDILSEMIDRYGEATVAEFYDLVGITRNGYTDRSYGWKDLRGANIRHTRDGYLFEMPRVVELD